jgi:hypothetical protein
MPHIASAASGSISAVLVGQFAGPCGSDFYNDSCASGSCTCLVYKGAISGTVGKGTAEIDATEDIGLGFSPGCAPILAAVFISTNKDPDQVLGVSGVSCSVPSNFSNFKLIRGYDVEFSSVGASGWGTFTGAITGSTKVVAHYQGH